MLPCIRLVGDVVTLFREVSRRMWLMSWRLEQFCGWDPEEVRRRQGLLKLAEICPRVLDGQSRDHTLPFNPAGGLSILQL